MLCVVLFWRFPPSRSAEMRAAIIFAGGYAWGSEDEDLIEDDDFSSEGGFEEAPPAYQRATRPASGAHGFNALGSGHRVS